MTSAIRQALGELAHHVERPSKLPVDGDDTRAVAISAWASLPIAILPSGIRTTHAMPGAGAYAAAEAEVLPVEAQMTARAPSSTALLMAIVMPAVLERAGRIHALELEVELDAERRAEARRGTSGVSPSPSVMTGVASVTGRYAR